MKESFVSFLDFYVVLTLLLVEMLASMVRPGAAVYPPLPGGDLRKG